MPVKVFGSPTSAEVARVLACLFEKDVEFQLIRVDSFRGTKRLPQSFDVPSADMVYSLAYLPPDMQLDGRGGGGLPAATGTMNPAHRQKVEEMLQLFEKSRRQLGKLLDIYEQRLGEEAFLAGGKFTLADLSHLPNADRLAGDPRSARLMESRRNVSKWWDTVSRRDSWVRVKELQRPPSAEAPF
uniref:glutathione transferase n=1 Tax=Zea mays TaxID=4577 RepID=B6SJP0_MAIZE|nr:hypothetical protein [Zea mays]